MNTGKRLFIEQLYHLYAEKLYNIAYVKLEYDEEKANKVLQETFSIACMKIDVLYYSEYPFAWLLQVQSFVIKREKFRICMGKTEEEKYEFAKEISMDTLPKDQIPTQESESHENSLFEELQDILSTKELDHIEQRCKNYKKSTKDIEQLNKNISLSSKLYHKVKSIIKKHHDTK